MKESLKIKQHFQELNNEFKFNTFNLFKELLQRQHYEYIITRVNDYINEIIRAEDILEKPLIKKCDNEIIYQNFTHEEEDLLEFNGEKPDCIEYCLEFVTYNCDALYK